jgi:hypothetical protein
MENVEVKYFAVRGRCEPVLLCLADSRISYRLQTVELADWVQWKKSGAVDPPDYPTSSLPILSFTTPDGGDSRHILGETNAILFLLDRLARPSSLSSSVNDALKQAQEVAVLEMSMFYLNRVFQLTADKVCHPSILHYPYLML